MNIHAMHRKFERDFLKGRSSFDEVRPDTKGASHSEVQESEYRNNLEQDFETRLIKLADITYFPDVKEVKTRDSPEILGTIGVDYENDLVYNLPQEAHPYKNKEGETKFFRYRSRGRK